MGSSLGKAAGALVSMAALAAMGCEPCRSCAARRSAISATQPSARYPVATVTGVVTYRGQPLARGTIAFFPDAELGGSGPAAFGEIDDKGHYRLSTVHTGDGAVVGPHRVQIRSRAGWTGAQERLPTRYNERTTLRAVVRPEPNTINFPLH